MEPNNPTEKMSDNKANDNYNSPITILKPAASDLKNKITIIHTFFITLNIILFILLMSSGLAHINNTCYEMGCLATLPFLFLITPVFGIFLYGIIKVIYDHSKDVSVTNINEIKHSGTLKSYLKLTFLMFFIFMGTLALFYYQEIKQNAELKKNEVLYNQTVNNPWINDNNQRRDNIFLISGKVFSFIADNHKLPQDLKELGLSNIVDPNTKKPYRYFLNKNTRSFAVCAELDTNSQRNKKEIWCDVNNDPSTNYLSYESVIKKLNETIMPIICEKGTICALLDYCKQIGTPVNTGNVGCGTGVGVCCIPKTTTPSTILEPNTAPSVITPIP